MRSNHVEILTGIICIALAGSLALYITASSWHTPGQELTNHSSFFPLTACGLLGLLGLLQFMLSLRLPLSEKYIRINLKGLALVGLWVLFAYSMNMLGFLLSGVIFLGLSILLWGERRFPLLLTVSIGLPLFIYITLGKMLQVAYPQGILPF